MGVGSSLHNELYQKRSVMERSCRVSIQPSDDTQTPLHSMKRATREVGRGLKYSEAWVVRLRSVLFGLSTCCELEASSLGMFCATNVDYSMLTKRYYVCPGAMCLFFSLSQLKHQIMNSLLWQEAMRTECPFKFELITNNLHPHSREF